jgi:hypothetical protein
MKGLALSPPFPSPENIKLESCSPESVLTDLDGSLELDGLELGPELQFLLESHLTPSPHHTDSHALGDIHKVCRPCIMAATISRKGQACFLVSSAAWRLPPATLVIRSL